MSCKACWVGQPVFLALGLLVWEGCSHSTERSNHTLKKGRRCGCVRAAGRRAASTRVLQGRRPYSHLPGREAALINHPTAPQNRRTAGLATHFGMCILRLPRRFQVLSNFCDASTFCSADTATLHQSLAERSPRRLQCSCVRRSRSRSPMARRRRRRSRLPRRPPGKLLRSRNGSPRRKDSSTLMT